MIRTEKSLDFSIRELLSADGSKNGRSQDALGRVVLGTGKVEVAEPHSAAGESVTRREG